MINSCAFVFNNHLHAAGHSVHEIGEEREFDLLPRFLYEFPKVFDRIGFSVSKQMFQLCPDLFLRIQVAWARRPCQQPTYLLSFLFAKELLHLLRRVACVTILLEQEVPSEQFFANWEYIGFNDFQISGSFQPMWEPSQVSKASRTKWAADSDLCVKCRLTSVPPRVIFSHPSLQLLLMKQWERYFIGKKYSSPLLGCPISASSA